MKIQVQMIAALENVYTRFSSAPAAAQVAAERVMNEVGRYLLGRVRQNLSGEVLQAKTGELRDSMRYEVTTGPNGITARVFSDGSVRYARIQETGGVTSPHEIIARRGKALRYFSKRYGLQFSFSVHHPGSKIPASMYLRRLLISDRTNVVRMIRQGMKGAV